MTGPSAEQAVRSSPIIGSYVSWSIMLCRDSRPGDLRRHGRVGEELLADDPVGQRLAERVGRGGDVDGGDVARLEVVQERHGLAEDHGRPFESLVRRVRDGARSRPSSSRRSACDQRHGDRRLGADRPQRSEPDREIADPRRIALERRRATGRWPPAEGVAADRRGQQGATRHAQLVGLARGREDAEVDLRGAVRRARGAAHDRDLVDDHARCRAGAPRSRTPRRRRPRSAPASSATPTRADRAVAGRGS